MSVVNRPGPASTLAAVVRYLLDTPHVSTRVNNHIYGQELNTIQDGMLPKMPARRGRGCAFGWHIAQLVRPRSATSDST